MDKIIEIQWVARAGQGAVTAAKMLAECAITEGRFAQAMPEYGPERAGAPMKAYNRVSRLPIRVHSRVSSPDFLIFLDPTLLTVRNSFEGLKESAAVIVNSPEKPEEIRKKIDSPWYSIFSVDGNRISEELTGLPFPNLPLLGAALKLTGIVKVETLIKQVQKSLGEKISSGNLEGYARSIQRGYDEVARESAPEIEKELHIVG